MATCAVPGCKSHFYNKSTNLQFFCFPRRNPKLCAQWVKVMKKDNWKPLRWDKVCSLHFTVLDYIPRIQGVTKFLKATAVPNQMLGRTSNFETKDNNNSLMEDSQLVTASIESNVETTETVQSNLRPIALIRVLHKTQTPVANVKQTKPCRILPQKVSKVVGNKINNETVNISSEKMSSELGNKTETETSSVLLHKVSNSLSNEKQTEPSKILSQKMSCELGNETQSDSILPHKVFNSVVNDVQTEEFNVSSDKVSNPYFHEMENETDSILPEKELNSLFNEKEIKSNSILSHKVSNSVDNKKRTKANNILPQNVSNFVGKKKIGGPINRLSSKISNAVTSNDKDIELANILSRKVRNAIANDKRSEIIKTLSRPLRVYSNNKRTEFGKLLMHKGLNEKKIDSTKSSRFSHHTMRIIPVTGSEPILTIQCPLSNQESYMMLPLEFVAKQNVDASSMEVNNEKTTEDQTPNKDVAVEQMLKHRHNFSESTQIEALKKEIVRLNQTIFRQKKRLQCFMQMRGPWRGHNERHGENL